MPVTPHGHAARGFIHSPEYLEIFDSCWSNAKSRHGVMVPIWSDVLSSPIRATTSPLRARMPRARPCTCLPSQVPARPRWRVNWRPKHMSQLKPHSESQPACATCPHATIHPHTLRFIPLHLFTRRFPYSHSQPPTAITIAVVRVPAFPAPVHVELTPRRRETMALSVIRESAGFEGRLGPRQTSGVEGVQVPCTPA
jgi:hypothetical protein